MTDARVEWQADMVTGTHRRVSHKADALKQALGELEGFHSAQDLHTVLQDRGVRMGLSTIYRVLQRMGEDGEVSIVYGRGQEALYRLCGAERHFHLVCRQCQHTVEVQDPRLAAWPDQLARRYGFAEVEPTQEIVGVCARCAGTP